MSERKVRTLTNLLLVMAVCGLSGKASAAYIDDGFESNTTTGSAPANWTTTQGGDATVTVTGSIVKTGTRSVVFQDGPGTTGESGWYPQMTGYFSSITGPVTFSMDARMDCAAAVSATQGLAVFLRDNGSTNGIAFYLAAESNGSGGYTQSIYLNGTSSSNKAELNFTLNTGEWFSINLTANANTVANSTYSLTITQGNNSQTIKDIAYTNAITGGWRKAVFQLTPGSGTSSPATVYIDNVKLDDAAIPEPSAVGLLSLGAVGMLARRAK